MFSRAASSLRNSGRSMLRSSHFAKNQQRRNMGGGSHWMEVSDVHTNLGWRHPWEHAEDPWAANVPKEDDIEGIVELRAEWEKFNASATNPEEDDDEDEDDDDDDDE